MRTEFTFEAEVIRWAARADAWFFAVVPVAESAEIADIPLPPRGFGGVKVAARIGATEVSTSIFPGSGVADGTGSYVLPLKRALRDAEGIEEGDVVTVELKVVV